MSSKGRALPTRLPNWMMGPRLSAAGLEAVKRMLAGEEVSQEESGMSKREWREMMEALGREG